MYIFHDDSGNLKPGARGFFCPGLLLSKKPYAAYRIIKNIRNSRNFYDELHFHKISEQRAYIYVDVINSILTLEECSFYGMIVNNENASRIILGKKEYVGVNRIVKTLMSQCSLHFPHNIEAVVFTDKKLRVRQDNFTDYIRNSSRRENFKIRIKEVISIDSKDDDLIQTCDLITGAVRIIFSSLSIESEWRNFVIENVRETLNNDEKVKVWYWEQIQ